MRRALAPILVAASALVLAGCVRVPLPQKSNELGPETGPEVIVLVSKTGQAARTLMHDVAVNCWLDGIVAGAQMIVEPGGNIAIVGDVNTLVAADYINIKGGRSRWRLSGTAISDPAKTRRLVQSIDNAVKTGVTSCPSIVG